MACEPMLTAATWYCMLKPEGAASWQVHCAGCFSHFWHNAGRAAACRPPCSPLSQGPAWGHSNYCLRGAHALEEWQKAGLHVALWFCAGVQSQECVCLQVSLFSENGTRWLLADQAVMLNGAADAVRGASGPASELAYILRHSGSTTLLTQVGPIQPAGSRRTAELLLELAYLMFFATHGSPRS